MKRTTIVADENLLDRLRAVARRDGISLAEAIREGMAWRARQGRRKLGFIGAATDPAGPSDVASHAHEQPYEPISWR